MGSLIKLWVGSDRFRIVALIIAITLFGAILLISQSRESEWKSHLSDFGTRDFVVYWSAFNAVKDGKNPYSMPAIYPFQDHVIKDEKLAQAFLNPPWALSIMAPVLVFDFTVARFLWIILNAAFIYLTIILIFNSLHGGDSSRTIDLMLGSLFLPSVWTIWMGQITLFLTVCFAAAFVSMMKGRAILAGLFLIPLTLKPHLFLVVGVVLAVYLLRKKLLPLMMSFIFGFLALQLITYLFSPQIYSNWLSMEYSPLIQKTSSVVTIIRESMQFVFGTLVDWPVVAVPLVGTVLFVPWLLKQYGNSNIELLLPPSLCISLGIAPYSWLHDFSLLLVCQSTLLVLVSRIKPPYAIKIEITLMLVVLQLAIVIGIVAFEGFQYLFWIPWAMLVIWIRSSNLLYSDKARHV
ncbi:MAG: glycosyltransferase family 87 protein [Candidatus Sedimenticola sp. (ex Thyasira tokunagai)]